MQDTVNSVTGKGKAAAGDAYASAKDAATTGKYKAQQAAGDASQYASDSASSAKDSANQFAGHATNKQGIFDKVRNAVTGRSNDAAAAGDQANYYARTGVDSAAQYAARANDKAGSATGDAAQYAKDSINSAKDAAGQFAGHAGNTAQGKQGGIWDKVKNVVTGHSNDAANAGETAGEYVNSARNTAGQYAQDAKNQASHQSNKAGKYAQVWHLLACLVMVDALDKLWTSLGFILQTFDCICTCQTIVVSVMCRAKQLRAVLVSMQCCTSCLPATCNCPHRVKLPMPLTEMHPQSVKSMSKQS